MRVLDFVSLHHAFPGKRWSYCIDWSEPGQHPRNDPFFLT